LKWEMAAGSDGFVLTNQDGLEMLTNLKSHLFLSTA
jgi:hypothetical protein